MYGPVTPMNLTFLADVAKETQATRVDRDRGLGGDEFRKPEMEPHEYSGVRIHRCMELT